MIKCIKNIILCITLLLLCASFNPKPIYSENVDDNLINKSVLVLCSYNSRNMWEASILQGLMEGLGNRLPFKIEYLDVGTYISKEYISSYVDVLNIKYKNKKVDCVLAIDDEALILAKYLVFNENSFMYHKDIVFAGVNNYIPLNLEEQKYIKGLFEYQDNSELIDIILKSSSKIDTIYLLLDNNTYSYTLESNIKNLNNTQLRHFNVKTIRSKYFEDIIPDIKSITPQNTAIILSGVYMYNSNNEEISPDLLIRRIQTLTKAPIYTTLNAYALNGAIGGKVNDGFKLGEILSQILIDTVSNKYDTHIAISFNNSFSKLLFNYKELMKYNIDPSILPTGTEFINKGPFDLLISKPMKLLLLSIIILIFLSFIYLFLSHSKERKTALEKDILLNESLERDKIRTDFVLTISHELRTPLNIITNATNLLKIKINKNNVDLDFFNSQLVMISKNSNRLLRLINNLIDVSKIELGHMDSIFKNENIVEVVEDATLSVVSLARSHDINIIFDTDQEEIITSIDKNKIERIMLNLLSNSIKFTNPGGEIYVNIEKKDKNIIVTVKDTGIGMTEGLQKNLFEKFSKEKSYNSLEREYEGSGLGLYIVKGLVNLHNGTIDVYSELNVGTTFIITIPQVVIDSKNDSIDLRWATIDYLSKIELSDIDEE